MTKFDTLYHMGSKGVIYEWTIHTEGVMVYTRYGQMDGVKIESSFMAEPKNIGKKNATTGKEQAIKEAKALWQNKLARKYSLTPDAAADELFFPMLAKEYEKNKKKVKFPWFVQYKYNGARCLAKRIDDTIYLITRQGKLWTQVPHVNEALKEILPVGDVFDGELYHHGSSLQTILSWLKKNKPESKNIKYVIYDYPIVQGNDGLNTQARLNALQKLKPQNQTLIIAPFSPVFDEDDLEVLHDKATEEGYEGLILRNPESTYKWGYRSADLLKVKEFEDAEFKVVGFRDGKGKYEGCAIWLCENEDGKTFDVNPMGSMEVKADYYSHAKSYIGKHLTVKFKGRTDSNIPIHAVGVAFRPEEDLDY